jgi:hypothetical protein
LKAESEEEFKMLAIRNPVMSLPATKQRQAVLPDALPPAYPYKEG